MSTHRFGQRQFTVTVAALAFAAVTASTAVRVAYHLGHPEPNGIPKSLADFRDNYYYPGVAFVAGINPYDVSRYGHVYPVTRMAVPYPPLSLLLHLPFASLPERAAETADFMVNVVASIGLAYLTVRLANLAPAPELVLGVAALLQLSRPGHTTMFLGQGAFYLSAAAYLALLYARQRPWLAAIGVALALTKPTFGAPLAVLLLCRREFGAVLRGVGLAVGLSIPMTAALVQRAGGTVALLESMRGSFREFANDPGVWNMMSVIRMDLASSLGRLASHPLGPVASLMVMAAALALGGLVVSRLARAEGCGPQSLSASVACMTLLLCTYHQAYDALLLAAPICVLASATPLLDRMGLRPYRWPLIALLSVPAVNYLASDAVEAAFGLTGTLWQAIVFANGFAVVLAFTIWIVLALSRPGDFERGRLPPWRREPWRALTRASAHPDNAAASGTPQGR